ncbi:hypothetical protein PT2222_90138 [Paraburkholderia tropica]
MPAWAGVACVMCRGEGALLAQHAHGGFEPRDGERIHAMPENLADHRYRLPVFPEPFGFGIEPREMRELIGETAQPHGARFRVVVLDRAARLQHFVRAHGGVADEDQLVVGRELVQQVPRGRALRVAAAIVLPQVVVDAVVKVVELQMLELGLRGGEEFLGALDVVVHRAAHVEQHQHFHLVVALRHHLEVEPARVGGGAADGVGEIEFFGRAFAREAAQTAQRDLDVARADFHLIVVVAIRARVPHLHGAALAAFAADADAFGVIAAVAERRGAARADPLAAAFVALLLLVEQLLEAFHELVEPAHRFDLRALLGREVAFEPLLEPVLGNLERLRRLLLDAAEIRAERLIEAVEILLVLHERHAREKVEVVERGRDHALLERFHEREVLLDGDRQLRVAQRVEEVDQHADSPCLVRAIDALTRGLAVVAVHVDEPLEQRHVLFVLEQRARERRHRLRAVDGAQRFGRHLFGEQQLEPVEQFRRGRLLLQARDVAQFEETLHRGAQQFLADARIVHLDDALHRGRIGKADVVEEAAAQEGVGQLLLVVRRDDHERTLLRLDEFARLVDVELHAVEFAQQVVREFDVGLVDLVDQQDARLLRLERLPQHALDDVVADVLHALVAELRIAQARHRVVFVEALLRLRGGLDVPLHERHVERGRDFLGQHRLAGARLALDEQRTLQGDRGIDRELEVVGGDVLRRAFETRGAHDEPLAKKIPV